MTGTYIHIPFCRCKCLYCDFFSVGDRLADWNALVSAILNEARFRISSGSFLNSSLSPSSDEEFTLYIGGGTPSLMPSREFERLSSGIRELLGNIIEFTIEVNPDDVNGEMIKVWKDSGVSRISMGVQSLVDTELKAIGRRHDANEAVNAYELLRKNFKNISLDLMFGLPGQTEESLMHTLKGFLKMRPEHISAYSLMYEERSALTRLLKKGEIEEVSDIDSYKMFGLISESLAMAGYEQYEISNYALPSFRSRHNSLYWTGKPYIGLGPGAHGFNGLSTRYFNKNDISSYNNFWNNPQKELSLQGDRHICEYENLSVDELREEFIMTRLRTVEGLDIEEFSDKFGLYNRDRLLRSANKYIKTGHVLESDSKLILTKKGLYISDDIISSLF